MHIVLSKKAKVKRQNKSGASLFYKKVLLYIILRA